MKLTIKDFDHTIFQQELPAGHAAAVIEYVRSITNEANKEATKPIQEATNRVNA